MEQEKLLKDIFKNFSNNSNLLNAKIISVNLFKKSNKIDIQLKSCLLYTSFLNIKIVFYI